MAKRIILGIQGCHSLLISMEELLASFKDGSYKNLMKLYDYSPVHVDLYIMDEKGKVVKYDMGRYRGRYKIKSNRLVDGIENTVYFDITDKVYDKASLYHKLHILRQNKAQMYDVVAYLKESNDIQKAIDCARGYRYQRPEFLNGIPFNFCCSTIVAWILNIRNFNTYSLFDLLARYHACHVEYIVFHDFKKRK